MKIYDSIRKVGIKNERLKMMIQHSAELTALELYQLALDFSDEEILTLIDSLKDSLSSFSLQSLIGLIKSADKQISALLAVKDSLAPNDLALLIGRISQPIAKLQAIQGCKELLTDKSYISIITSKNNVAIAEKVIDIWNTCPSEEILISILDNVKDEGLQKRLAETFLRKKGFPQEKIDKIKTLENITDEPFNKLDLENLTFGIELEFGIVDTDEALLWDYICGNFRKKGFSIKSDMTLTCGAEITTPVLTDSKENWSELARLCRFIKNIGGEVNQECGTHIHFGASAFEENPQIFRKFLEIWQEVEPLIYMISNKEGEKTEKEREKSIKPIASRIQELFQVTGKKELDISEMVRQLDVLDKGYSVNLRNLILKNPKKYTIEFRLANGTLDYDTIREEVKLYASLLQLSKELTHNPSYRQEKQDEFFRTDINEEEKLKALTDLLFEDEKLKDIYIRKLQSVKDAGFVIQPKGEVKFQPSFVYKELQKMANIVPGYLQEEAIAEILQMTAEKEHEKEELER